MRSGRPAALLAILVAGTGCQESDAPPVSASCTDEPATIVRALAGAPRAVALEDGARLSACVRDAQSDADLQNVGVTFSQAAEDLELQALRGDERAALQLGYLVGAARRGAQTTSGVGAELVRRLERSAAALDGVTTPAAGDALRRGLAAGEARG